VIARERSSAVAIAIPAAGGKRLATAGHATMKMPRGDKRKAHEIGDAGTTAVRPSSTRPTLLILRAFRARGFRIVKYSISHER